MSSLEQIKTCNACDRAKPLDEFYLKDKATKRYANTCKQCEKLRRDREKGELLPIVDMDFLSEEEEFEEVVGFFEILNRWNKDMEIGASETNLELL